MSPYVRRHINFHGPYSFLPPTSVAPDGRYAACVSLSRWRSTGPAAPRSSNLMGLFFVGCAGALLRSWRAGANQQWRSSRARRRGGGVSC